MSKLEEVSSKRLILVDNIDARKNHVLTFAFTLVLGVVYTSFLWFVCSTRPGVMSAILLFASQIAIGFPATRAYYDLGVSNRENLHFIDPAKFNGNGKMHEVEIHLGEIQFLFEKIDLQIRKYDLGSLDDLSDIAWFGIFVWAAYSSTSFFFRTGSIPLCLIGTIVLLLSCLGSYLSGYWTKRNFEFEDDLSHLQYYVEKRLQDIDAHLPKDGSKIMVQVLERWRSMSLLDFNVQLMLGKDSVIQYHMGFPSDEQERIIVQANPEVLKSVSDGLSETPSIEKNGWYPEQTQTTKGSVLQIMNRSSTFSVSIRSSFVTSPSVVDISSGKTAEAFSKVISLVNQGSLS